MHEPEYTDQDMWRLEREVRAMGDVWNKLADKLTQGRSTLLGVHPAPAVMAIMAYDEGSPTPLGQLIENIASCFEHADSETSVRADLYAGFAHMFVFSQACFKAGIRYEELLQCKCGDVTPEIIKDLIEGTHG